MHASVCLVGLSEMLSFKYDVFTDSRWSIFCALVLTHTGQFVDKPNTQTGWRIEKLLANCSVRIPIAVSIIHCSNYKHKDLFVFDLIQHTAQSAEMCLTFSFENGDA